VITRLRLGNALCDWTIPTRTTTKVSSFHFQSVQGTFTSEHRETIDLDIQFVSATQGPLNAGCATFNTLAMAEKAVRDEENSDSGTVEICDGSSEASSPLFFPIPLSPARKAKLIEGLNIGQTHVVTSLSSFSSGIHFVQGPPGTGKSKTIARAVAHRLNTHPNKIIMMCAPSHAAVNNLMSRLPSVAGILPSGARVGCIMEDFTVGSSVPENCIVLGQFGREITQRWKHISNMISVYHQERDAAKRAREEIKQAASMKKPSKKSTHAVVATAPASSRVSCSVSNDAIDAEFLNAICFLAQRHQSPVRRTTAETSGKGIL
jgi:hypothetical protein